MSFDFFPFEDSRDDVPKAMSSSLRRGFGSYFSRGSPAPSAMSASSDSVGQSSDERARIEGGSGLGREEEEVEASAEGSSSVEVTGIGSSDGSSGSDDEEGSEGALAESSEEEGGARSAGTRWVQDSSAKNEGMFSSWRTTSSARLRELKTYPYASCNMEPSNWESRRAGGR